MIRSMRRVSKNVALTTKANKKKKDMSQVKCYQCGQMGHYASKCLEKKKGKIEKDPTATTVVEDFAAKFEQEFSLISIDSSIGSSSFERV